MPAEKSLALVLKTVDFSDTSQIATLFTRDHGKISVLAKGARRLRGPFEAALDLLTVCRIVWLRKSSGELDLLTEAQVVERFRPRAREVQRYYAGFYVAELLLRLTTLYDPSVRLFDEAVATLQRLQQEQMPPLTVARFELVTLRELGHFPNLNECAGCHQPVEPTASSFFSLRAAGLICRRCRSEYRTTLTVRGATVRALRWLASEDPQHWQRLRLDQRTDREVRQLLNRYLRHVAEHKFRLHPYLTTASRKPT